MNYYKIYLLPCGTYKENFYKYIITTCMHSMGRSYENLDEKIKQLPGGTIYGIYKDILEAAIKEGIKVEKNDNITIIDIRDPKEESYLTILYNKDEKCAEIHYKLSGRTAKEIVNGIGQHFPIFEGLDELTNNVSYVKVQTRIRNNEKKCKNGSKYCKKISVDIEIIRKSYSNPKHSETQLQQPTELGIKLAKRSLDELLNHATNGKIDVFVSDDGTVYVTLKDNREPKEPIFIYYPSHEKILHSYTISGESAKDLIKEIGKYVPLPRNLKKAKNIRVIWKNT